MESVFFFIIIIIVINLLNAFMKAAKGGLTASQRGAFEERDRLMRAVAEESLNDQSFYVHSPAPLKDHHEKHLDAADEKHAEAEHEVYVNNNEKAAELRAVQESGPQSAVVSNLHQVLNRKDSLVAAFIFHEIIGPPLAQRKRR